MSAIQVPLVVMPTPMHLEVSADVKDGETVGHILVTMPMATFLIGLTGEDAHGLIAQLVKEFGEPPPVSGLTIAREMPDGPNGSRP